ncbi:hypothetical protein [Demequina aurantiaca]|uniref:hypothetical protein n=1 Tax=Demequina aurantiaca TaxID=676200 RepID=UPI003D342BFA
MARGFSYAPGSSPDVVAAQAEEVSRADILEFGSSNNKLVREAIAARADCPLGVLVGLAHDHVGAVRVAVASNPTASQTILDYLSADRSVDVLMALLSNPSIPTDLVRQLALHRKSAVRRAATERLNSPEHAADAVEDEHNPELRDRGFEPLGGGDQVPPALALPAAEGAPGIWATVQEPPAGASSFHP